MIIVVSSSLGRATWIIKKRPGRDRRIAGLNAVGLTNCARALSSPGNTCSC